MLRNLRPQISQGMQASEGRNCRALLPAGMPNAEGVPTNAVPPEALGGGVNEHRGTGEGEGERFPLATEIAELTEPLDPVDAITITTTTQRTIIRR